MTAAQSITNDISLWVTILGSLLSGLLGALLTTVIYVRREDRKFKVDTLKRFASNRFDVQSDEFSRSLNEILVVFNDSKTVMRTLQDFHDVITSGKAGLSNDRLVRLFKAMCDDAGIDYKGMNDSFFLQPFNVREGSRERPN